MRPTTSAAAWTRKACGSTSRSRALTDRLIFWRDPPPPGTPVDPRAESERLRENAALGRDGNIGETPVVQPRRRSFFEWLGF